MFLYGPSITRCVLNAERSKFKSRKRKCRSTVRFLGGNSAIFDLIYFNFRTSVPIPGWVCLLVPCTADFFVFNYFRPSISPLYIIIRLVLVKPLPIICFQLQQLQFNACRNVHPSKPTKQTSSNFCSLSFPLFLLHNSPFPPWSTMGMGNIVSSPTVHGWNPSPKHLCTKR